MTVETYNLKASNGKHIRKATQVTFDDGSVVRFLEKMTKREAIEQAAFHKTRSEGQTFAAWQEQHPFFALLK